jgi:hypothetical protein
MKRLELSRRTTLRGMWASVALPALEAMIPARASAQSAQPLRVLFTYLPNGWPAGGYADTTPYQPGLDALASVRADVTLVHGITNNASTEQDTRKDQIGADGHGSAAVTTMSSEIPSALGSNMWGVRTTLDQVIAKEKFSDGKMRFPSLGINVRPGGSVDTYHAPIYARTVFWKGPNDPVTLHNNPRALFDLMFGTPMPNGNADEAAKTQSKKSVLDFVRNDITTLQGKVGAADRAKLQEYFTSVRSLETEVAKLPTTTAACAAPARPADDPNNGIDTYPTRYGLLQDLIVKAFECDLTRVVPFMIGHETLESTYAGADLTSDWHSYSHNDYAGHRKILAFHFARFRELITKLKSKTDALGAHLLDSTLLTLFSGQGDAGSHADYNMQMFMAGKGGGRYKTGITYDYKNNRDIGDVWLTILRDFGVARTSFGKGNKVLNEIKV